MKHLAGFALALVVAACSHPKPAPAVPEGTTPEPAPLAATPEPVVVAMTDGRIVPSQPPYYATGRADLLDASEPVVAAVAEFLAGKDSISMVRVEVHTDSMGMDDANQRLSEARANAFAQALVAHGIDCARVIPVGFGETKPIADNAIAEGRAANRRTEIVVVALRGTVIGGLPVDGGGKVAGDPCAR